MDILGNIYFYFPFYLLLLARMLGMLAASPFYGSKNINPILKVSLAFFVAFIIFPSVYQYQNINMDVFPWLLFFVSETMVGVAMGFTCNLVFYAVQVAGQFVDLQMGFGFANVLDPQSGIQVPIMGNFNQILAMLVFMMINGHHWLLQGVFYSYEVLPMGGMSLHDSYPDTISWLILNFFIIAFQISMPAMAAIFLADVSLGIISRTVPQMNVFIVGMPLKIIIGFFVLMMAIPLFIYILHGMYGTMMENMFKMLNSIASMG